MVEFLAWWVVASMLYLASAVWCRVVWREELPVTVSASLLFFGAAIFLAVNRRLIVTYGATGAELAAFVFVLIAWFTAMVSLRAIVAERRRLNHVS